MEFQSLFHTPNGVVWSTTDAEGHEVWSLFDHGFTPWCWADGRWYSPAAAICGEWLREQVNAPFAD